jgi:hypothetical protein
MRWGGIITYGWFRSSWGRWDALEACLEGRENR